MKNLKKSKFQKLPVSFRQVKYLTLIDRGFLCLVVFAFFACVAFFVAVV